MGIFDAAGVCFTPTDFAHSKRRMSSGSFTDQSLPDKEPDTILDTESRPNEVILEGRISKVISKSTKSAK